MTEHERLSLVGTVRFRNGYAAYVARCAAEDLPPLSERAWNVVRWPLTPESMERAWLRMSCAKRMQGWKRGLAA